MTKREIVVEAKLRGTQITTRIVVPRTLAQVLIRNDENLEERKKSGYIQARESFKKETGRDPGWLDVSNCDFKIIGGASWAFSEKEKPKKPFQLQLFRIQLQKEKIDKSEFTKSFFREQKGGEMSKKVCPHCGRERDPRKWPICPWCHRR